MSARPPEKAKKEKKKKEEEEEEEEREDDDGRKAKKIKKDLAPALFDSTKIENHVYHIQDPGAYENNCSFSVWFAFLELLTLMRIEPSFVRYKAVTEAGIKVHQCLQRLVKLFQRVAEDPSDHDPANKSSSCLRIWCEMIQEVCPAEMPKWNAERNKRDCVGGVLTSVIIPLSSLCEVLMQKMCSCAVALQDAGQVVPWRKPMFLPIR
jgi:hypothetical protein